MRSPRAPLAVALTVAAASSVVAPRVAQAVRCPNILFILDRSGSMADTPDGKPGASKWKLLQDAVKTIVTKYGDQVPFGLEMFTSSGFNDNTCFADTKIDVEPGHETAQKIISLITAAKPDSGTNTAQAIRRAAQDKALADKSRAEYVVLITDGDPNCPFDDSSMAKYTVGEISTAAGQSPPIHTFVIGFDGDTQAVRPDNLNRMAMAGKEPVPGCTGTSASPCYYSASNAAKFAAAIEKVISTVVSGEFGGGMCDDSCLSNGCPSGQRCSTDEQNLKPHCVADPCANVVGCDPSMGDYCRDGACVHACLVACKAGQRCVDGSCVADACAGKLCDNDEVCDPNTGQCSGKCVGRICQSATSTCDLATGACVPDPCKQIACPAGTMCRYGGNCESTKGAMAMDPAGQRGRNGPGCAVSPVADAGRGLLVLVGVGLFGLLRPRRRRRD